MFVNIAGWTIGGAGLPVAMPVALASSGVAIALGLAVAVAAGALVLSGRDRARGHRVARPQRRGRARGLALVPGRAATP